MANSVLGQDFTFSSEKNKTEGSFKYAVSINDQLLSKDLKTKNSVEIKFDDQVLVQPISKIQNLSNGYRGLITSPTFQSGSSHILIKNGRITGLFNIQDQLYKLSYFNENYILTEVTETGFICDIEHVADKQPLNKSLNYDDYDIKDYSDTTTVDLLVLYTTRAKKWAENDTSVFDIDELIALNESKKNEIIDNSNLALKIRFVGTVEIANSHQESNGPTEHVNYRILNSLYDNTYNFYVNAPDDTVNIYDLRSRFGADLVTLIDSTTVSGGIANVLSNEGGSSRSAYSFNSVRNSVGSYVFMHELGHNFGNLHGRTQANNAASLEGGIFPFSTGYLIRLPGTERYVTVMHYRELLSGGIASRIPYFSNPRISFQGEPAGSSTNETDGINSNGGPSDNVLSMSITKDWISKYKPTIVDAPKLALNISEIRDTLWQIEQSTNELEIFNTGKSDLELEFEGYLNYESSYSGSRPSLDKELSDSGNDFSISDKRITIPANTSKAVQITASGKYFIPGLYTGKIIVSSNDPLNQIKEIPVEIGLQSNADRNSGHFNIEIPISKGTNFISLPVDLTANQLFDSLLSYTETQGLDSIKIWIKSFTSGNNSDYNWSRISDFNDSLNIGDLIKLETPSTFPDSLFNNSVTVSSKVISSTNLNLSSPNEDGLVFLGNPLPSTIAWNRIPKPEYIKAIYSWNSEKRSWETYSNRVGDLRNGWIGPLQSFLVYPDTSINDQSISIDYNHSLLELDIITEQEGTDYFKLNLKSDINEFNNNAFISFNSEAKNGFDTFDAFELRPYADEYISLSSYNDQDELFDINVLEFNTDDIYEVPLNLQSNYSLSGELTLTDRQGLRNFDIYLTKDEKSTPLAIDDPQPVNITYQELNSDNLIMRKTEASENGYSITLVRKGVDFDLDPSTPATFELFNNYPNPFNPATNIKFGIPSSSFVTIEIFNILGQKVHTLTNKSYEAGFYTIPFQADNLSSGIYIYTLSAGNFTTTKKMALIK